MQTKQRIFTWTTLRSLLLGLALLLGPALSLARPMPAWAATFTVSNLNDSGAGSLRQVILNANAAAGADAISFNVNGTITLAATLPTITDAAGLTIDGAGHSIIISGNNAVQIMVVNAGTTLTVQNVTLANGATSANGGGISNSGTLNVTNSTFSGNRGNFGGGILNFGTLNVTNSTFLGNAANTSGGAIDNGDVGIATIRNSTFAGNSALNGGGLAILSGSGTVINSTFSGNSATNGGGIYSQAPTTLNNTIVANSLVGQDVRNSSSLVGSNNLIETGTGLSGLAGTLTADPNLGPLANNGGAPQTFALLPGSPAINAGNNTLCPATDQRGVTRPQGPACDIGAYEVLHDVTAPSPNPAQLPAANANGWNNSDVTVTWNWTDNAGGAGIDPANCATSSISSGEGTLTLTAACQDLAGNASSVSYPVQVDKTAPTITASATKADGTPYLAGSWSNQVVTVLYAFVESGSGVGEYSPGDTISIEGVTASVAGIVIDNAGNSASTSFGPIQIDYTAPDTAISSQPANPSSSNSATFAFSGSDTASGIISSEVASFACKLDSAAFAPCTSPQAYTNLSAGSHTFQVRAVDGAGNLDPTPASYIWSVQTDSAGPTASPAQSPAANANGWNNSDVTVNWNWTDPSTSAGQASGIDPANCTTSSVSSGEGTLTLTATCKDLAGNQGGASYTVKVDKTAPTVTVSTTNADSTPYTAPGFTNQNIIVHFTCSDDGSGIASCPADQTISAEGSLPAVQGTATDNAGNSTNAFAGPFQIDKTKPVITSSRTPAANANGWNNNDVTVSFICVDNANGSSIGSDTVAGATVSSEGSNQSVANSGTCVDVAGNNADTATISNINIDKSAPTLNPVVSPSPVNVGGTATVSSGSADALSGLASESCGALDTSTAGVKSVTCTATDKAGNSNSATVNYTVQVVNTGTLVGICGGYEVRQMGSLYSAAGWSGTIKVGTSGNNTLNGTSGRDLMLGLGGNDALNGQGGDDVLCGGDGVDLVQGLAGNDLLDGGAGNDVLNGGSGDYDQLLAGDGNDVLLDGDGVSNAAGGAGNDVFTIALRNGWRDANGQARFAGLSGGYGNDAVGLAILNSVQFLVDITGDERDNPASPLEGANDGLALGGVIDPTSTLIKFESVLVVSADAEQSIPSEESGAEFLSEPVGGDEASETALTNLVFLPMVSNQ